ncbi:MAG: response regulator transcription factor [Candidatus Coproplasma sp.]
MEKKLIYCVDDEEDIRELYKVAIANAGYDCSAFENGEELFKTLEGKLPSLIILDIMLDGEDGFAILQKLKQNAIYAGVPVIMVSAKGEELSKVKGLNMGADDYIAKPFGVLELIARINANLRKSAPATRLSYKNLSVNETNHEIYSNGNMLDLTVKEYSLLKLLIINAPNVVSREDVFNTVWGENYFGETRTLDIHISSLRKAISAGEAQIVTVRGVGYRLI